MGYPVGGKRLDNIYTTNSAYINLGFKPNQDTKVVLVASILKSGVTFAIGTTTRVDGTNFMVRTFSANNYWCADYGDALIQMPDTSVTMGNKTVFVLDRNVCTIGGITATVPSDEGITFESGNLLLLAGTQTNGSAASSNGTIYSCQVFDNGTLVRDCVPWELGDGSVGLWDVINDVFYGSAVSTKSFKPGYIEDALPEGCETVEYLRTTGKEYINTGIIPTGKTRLVMDAKVLPTQSENSYVFGMMKSGAFYWSVQYNDRLFSTRYAAQSETVFSSGLTAGVRYTIDKNRQITTIGGETIAGTAVESSGDVPIYLFARNSGNVADRFCQVEAWSCRIFEDDIPLQDLVVVRNADGKLGFYDLISGTVFLNAGTGAFETGGIIVTETEHSTVIDGTVYKLESGSVMIGGTVYEVENGRVMVDGVVYDVPFGVEAEAQEMVVLWLDWVPPHGSRIVVNGVTYTEAEGDQFLAVPKGAIVEVWDYASHYNVITGEWFDQDEGGNPLCLTINSGTMLVMDSSMGDDEVNLAEYAGDVGTYPIYIEGTRSASDAFAVIANGNTTYSKDFEYGDYIYVREGAEVTVRNDSTSAKAIELNGTVVAEASVDATYTFRMPKMEVEIDCYKAIRIRY